LDASESLLLKLGFESDMLQEETQDNAIDVETLQAKAQEGRVEIEELSSGKFSSFILALMLGSGLALGILYLASMATGSALDFAQFQNTQQLKPLLAWIAQKSMGSQSVMNGALILGGVSLIFSLLIYTIRVSLRATHNLRIAQDVHQKAQFYCTQKEECKLQMEKVDAHLNETVDLIDFYKVLLREQNTRLERIVFVEEVQEFNLYHYKSQADIQNTQRLLNGITQLLTTPIAQEGQLSQESILALQRAKEAINAHLKAIYDKNIDDVL